MHFTRDTSLVSFVPRTRCQHTRSVGPCLVSWRIQIFSAIWFKLYFQLESIGFYYLQDNQGTCSVSVDSLLRIMHHFHATHHGHKSSDKKDVYAIYFGSHGIIEYEITVGCNIRRHGHLSLDCVKMGSKNSLLARTQNGRALMESTGNN